jgi:hypothetical protein
MTDTREQTNVCLCVSGGRCEHVFGKHSANHLLLAVRTRQKKAKKRKATVINKHENALRTGLPPESLCCVAGAWAGVSEGTSATTIREFGCKGLPSTLSLWGRWRLWPCTSFGHRAASGVQFVGSMPHDMSMSTALAMRDSSTMLHGGVAQCAHC